MAARALATLTLPLVVGCAPDLGACDSAAALEVVYTSDGTPAFAGQGLVNQSCGGGAFCHSRGASPAARHGAPHGMDFDLTLASLSTDLNQEEIDRLGRDQLAILRMADEVHSQVGLGLMPPSGAMSGAVLASLPRYDRVGADGTSFAPLPSADSPAGQEILRNWLICGAPVVERTQERLEGDNTVGFTVEVCNRRCVDPSWPDIVSQILGPSCALSQCHDAEEPVEGLDLSVSDPGDAAALEQLHATLLAGTPQGELCVTSPSSETPFVVPGTADGSSLYRKLRPELLDCGALMPLSGSTLSQQRLCAIREWIECGACATAEDPTCADCLEDARVRCGVRVEDEGGVSCIDQEPCVRFVEAER